MAGGLVDGAEAAQALRALMAQVRGRSRLYERLLAGLAGAAERGFDGGVIARLLSTPGPGGLPEARLLLLAALHHAALEDPDRPHAAWFSTTSRSRHRSPDEGAPAALALAYLVEHEERVARFLETRRLQTNEVGRCAALLPGFLEAARFGLPLRLLELGCAAGLNLRFDRYRYLYAQGPTWGPVGGPELHTRAEGRAPRALVPPTVEVAERRGVDLNPLDVEDPEDRRLLHAFVWPDERDRHERLHGAIEVARSTPARLDRGDLVDWSQQVATPQEGVTTVLYHSQVRHHLDDATAGRLTAMVESFLRTASPPAPFTYIAYETPPGVGPADADPEVTIATSDGTAPPAWATVATADPHGRWVRWFT